MQSAITSAAADQERQQRIQERRARIRAKLDELSRASGGKLPELSALPSVSAMQEQLEATGGLEGRPASTPEASSQQVAVGGSSEAVAESAAEKAVFDALSGCRARSNEFLGYVQQMRSRADREAQTLFANDTQAAEVRRTALEAERSNCAKVDAAFAMRWSALLDKESPEEVAAGLLELRSLMLSMLEGKDRVVQAFDEYLGTVDDDYLRLIREQTRDVDEVLAYTRRTLRDLRQFAVDEVRACEEAFEKEREEYLKQREGRLDALREEIAQAETQALDDRQKLLEQYNDDTAEHIFKDYEAYTTLKRKLEAEGAALRQQLEEMRSVYQLNSDKLDYNYRLLAARDVESQNLIVQQRRKLSKLQDQLAVLVAKHTQVDERLRGENLELSTAYKRVSNLYCDLQKKFKDFERSDTQKFRGIWAYHERRLAAALKELLLAEQVINESVLVKDQRRETDERSLEAQVQLMLKRLQAAAGVLERLDEDLSAADSQAIQSGILDVARLADPVASCAAGEATARTLLQQLAREASFLASDRLLAVLAPGEEITEGMRVDALLSTLGIKSAAELDLLFSYITEGTKGYTLLGRDKLVDALRNFAAEVQAQRDRPDATQKARGDRASNRRVGIWSTSAQRAFWREMSNLISPAKQTMWRILEDTLVQYQEILQARADLVASNDELAAQNEELRGLLQQYLDQQRAQIFVRGESRASGAASRESTQSGVQGGVQSVAQGASAARAIN